MQLHYNSLEERQLVILRQIFLHYNKLKIAHYIIALKTLVAACNIYFIITNQIFHHFSKHKANFLLNSKPKMKLNTNNVVRNDMLNIIFAGVRIIYRIDMNKPINICTLWFFI